MTNASWHEMFANTLSAQMIMRIQYDLYIAGKYQLLIDIKFIREEFNLVNSKNIIREKI